MEKFKYLLNKRDSALGLFNKVVKKLDKVHDAMHQAVMDSHEEISEHEDKIKESQEEIESHKAAINYLEGEKAKTLETKQKITGLISG